MTKQHKNPRVQFQQLISTLLIIAICITTLPTSTYAQGYTFQECDTLDEAQLRDELNAIAQEALLADSINIEEIVERQWQNQGLNLIIDIEVEKAIKRVRDEEDYLGRLWSGWSSEKAKELTGKVANYAFGSQPFKQAITDLSDGVANEIALELEAASARSASSALICMQAFIGSRYTDTLVAVFEADIQQQMANLDVDVSDNQVSILGDHSSALAGVGIIIGTQIAKRLAQKLAQRLAGKIIGRVIGRAAASFVPIAGWIIGGALIVWDLIEGSNGALPQIQEALQGPDVKAEIRAETVDAIRPELARELPQVARTVANDIYSNWLDFKDRYTSVLNLADDNPNFHRILDDIQTEEIYKLARLVTTSVDTIGTEQLDSAIENGMFEQMLSLPESAIDILDSTKSMDNVLAWSTVAGTHLDDVVALEIYKLKSPEDFTRDSLAAIIAIQDAPTIAKMLLLDLGAVDTLLTLPTSNLTTLAQNYSVDDLKWLSIYLSEITDQTARNNLIIRLMEIPQIIDELKNERIKDSILNSDNIDDTLAFLSGQRTVQTFIFDTMTLWNGGISWRHHYQKYSIAWLILIGLLLLIILRFVWWYLKPFRSPNI